LNCSICNFSYDNTIEYLCPSCGKYENVNLFSDVPNYIKFLKDLVNKSSKLIDKLDNEGIPRDDIRREKLGAFNIITLATIYDLADYDNDIRYNDIRYNDSRIPKALKTDNPKLENDLIQKIIENIDLRNKFTYLVVSLFQFENLYTGLAKNMSYTGNKNYASVVKHVISNLDLENKPEKLDSMLLPSTIRNTLHSQGIFRDPKGKNKEFTVKNVSFKFEHEKQHGYVSWREIIFCFNNR